MQLKFIKMEGAGNDFLVLDARHTPIALSGAQIRRLAHRRTGVGFDQLLLIEKPESPQNTIAYTIFNADGSQVQQCGNGARALAAYIAESDATSRSASSDLLRMESASGLVLAKILRNGDVSVNMGTPNFDPAALPFLALAQSSEYVLDIDTQCVEFGAVSIGNPHVVIPVDNVDDAPVERLGKAFQQHPSFPESVNVGFMQVLNSSQMRLRVFERGAGETLACGTGACAAAAVAQTLGLVGQQVEIKAPGGDLLVSWAGDGQNAWLTGPCKRVFEGLIHV